MQVFKKHGGNRRSKYSGLQSERNDFGAQEAMGCVPVPYSAAKDPKIAFSVAYMKGTWNHFLNAF